MDTLKYITDIFHIHSKVQFEIFTNLSLKFQLTTLLSIANPYANASVIDTITPNPGMAATNTNYILFQIFGFIFVLKNPNGPFSVALRLWNQEY